VPQLQRFEDESLFANGERKSDVTTNVTSLSSSNVDATQCSSNNFRVVEPQHATRPPVQDLFSQKNSLLEIIQTFSEKRSDSSVTTAEKSPSAENHPSYGSHFNSRVEIMPSPVSHARAPSPPQNQSLEIIEEDLVAMKPSILKKKFDERSNSVDSPKPSSILKRKTFDETGGCGGGGLRYFSRAYRQGILKKHSSLDEEEVARRSCSPDVVNDSRAGQDFKPILKIQRRSSFEEIENIRSPELHSILKRSKQPSEELSDSGGASSPHHGILKRKLSVTNGFYDRRSLDSDTVVSDTESTVKPILKNKQTSSEVTLLENVVVETPKPILKKKYSDSEYEEEKPKKPILKCSSRKSLDEERIPSNRARFVEWQALGEERNIKPILKKRDGCYRMMDTRSVKSDDDTANNGYRNSGRIKRNSLPGECECHASH